MGEVATNISLGISSGDNMGICQRRHGISKIPNGLYKMKTYIWEP